MLDKLRYFELQEHLKWPGSHISINKPLLFLLIPFLILSVYGCSFRSFRRLRGGSPYRSPESLRVGEILHIPTGTLMSSDQLFAFLEAYRIVYLGDIHDNISVHEVQLRIVRALRERFHGKIVIGLEMFRKPSQTHLDRWIDGSEDETSFRREWEKNWGIDFEYYRPLLVFAREKHIPLVALNSSKREMGMLGSGAAHNVLLKIPDLHTDDQYHRSFVYSIWRDSRHGSFPFEHFYRVQLLWEETMAETAAEYLKRADKGTMMIVIAGAGHINYGFGIPKRLFMRYPVPYTTILPVTPEGDVEEISPTGKDIRRLEVDLPDMPLYIADFVWAVKYKRLPVSNKGY